MAFQCSDAGLPKRTTSYGSSSVSTTGSGEAASDAGTDVSAANTVSDQVLEVSATQDSENTGVGGGETQGGDVISSKRQEAAVDAERQAEETRVSEHVPPAAVFPNLPEDLLRELQEPPSDQDIENRFTAISIAFKTDKLTLEERVSLQKRWRDQAELNMIQEENNLRAAIQNLYYLCKDSTSIEIVTKVKEQVDILRWAVDWVARSSESVGAIQQESRVSKAMEVMLQYVENLKRIQGKQDEEGKKRTKLQSDDLTDGEETPSRTVRYRSLQPLPGMARSGSKRRASIAVIPRPPGNFPEPARASISTSPLYLESIPRSQSLSRSGSFLRRTSLTTSAAPSSPSTTSWDSTENLDTFENINNNFMDNIEEINESRRESCSSRLEQGTPTAEENNNCSLKRPSIDDADKTVTYDVEPTNNVSVLKKIYLTYDEYMRVAEAAKDTVMDHLDTDNIMFVIRRIVACLLILAAIYYLIAMFFEPAAAALIPNTQTTSLYSAEKQPGHH